MTINHDSEADAVERATRIGRIRTAMGSFGLDALLAFAPAWRRENVRYLVDTPLVGTASFVLLTSADADDGCAFSTRQADVDAIAGRGWVTDTHLLSARAPSALIDRLQAVRPDRLGIAHYELVPDLLMSKIDQALPRTEVVSATRLMDDLRLVKSEWEIDRMRQVADVVDAGWNAFVEVLKPGLPEYGIVAAVETAIKSQGAEDNFMLIASGGDEVRGMTAPAPRLLQQGDMVRTELTPQLNGYWLQICRSAVVGKASDAQRRSFDLFNEAVEAGITVVRPGVTAHEVARAQNDVFRARGLGEYCTSQYTRVRGHGHGLHIDETPIIEGNETELPENAVFIIHPNTYTPIAGYHVLGDPVRVTKTGAEVLISTERKLFEGAL
jgi:Xaa-Pro dipeptidase